MTTLTTLLIPLAGDFFSKTSDLAGQATLAVKSVIVVFVYAGLLFGIIKARFAMGAMVIAALAGAFVWWLVMSDGISVLAALFNGTLS